MTGTSHAIPANSLPSTHPPAIELLEDSTRQNILARALEQGQSAVIITDPQLRMLYANSRFEQLFGYSVASLIGQRPSCLFAHRLSDRHVFIRILANKHALQQQQQHELLLYHKDGSLVWTTMLLTPVAHPQGHTAFFVILLTDITESKRPSVLQYQVLEALAKERPLLEVMTLMCLEAERGCPDVCVAFTSVDNEGRLRSLVAPSLPTFYHELIDGQRIGPSAGASGMAAWYQRPMLMHDLINQPWLKDHRQAWHDLGFKACWSHPLLSSARQVLGTIDFFLRSRINPLPKHQCLAQICAQLATLALERDQVRTRIQQLAFYDGLTGLPNRVLFHARAEQLMTDLGQQHACAAVLFLNIDRFKRINDTQGHAAGDDLLRALAQRLTTHLDQRYVLGRVAGDEFTAMIPQCTAEQSAAIAERLLSCLHTPVQVGQISVPPSVSIGIALYPTDGHDAGQLLRHANLAMHRAKSSGGGRWHFFRFDMDRSVQERLALETELREAILFNRLQLHYQPQVIAEPPHTLYGVEALIRWEHPRFGPISPGQFLPLAEESGLIVDLGRWVIRRATAQLARWRAHGIAVPRVAVNLSPTHFAYPNMATELLTAMLEQRLGPDDVTLEITEGVMLSEETGVLSNLDALKSAGVRMSLDDFGTGYSSLSHLHRLPIDELKLDMRFVHDLESSEQARALTTSVLTIGRALNKYVVAEGVETCAQRELLATLGCQVLQGYLFSRPLPAQALERWLSIHPHPGLMTKPSSPTTP